MPRNGLLSAGKLLLPIVLLIGCASATPKPPGKRSASGRVRPETTLFSRADRAIAKGPRFGFFLKFGKNLPALFGFPYNRKAVEELVTAHETEDFRQRAFVVVLSTWSLKQPDFLMLMTLQWNMERREREDSYLRVELDGTLSAAFGCTGKLTEEARYVKGSCQPEPLALNAPATRELFQRELDFWLRGKGRKDVPPPPLIKVQVDPRQVNDLLRRPPTPSPKASGTAGHPASTPRRSREGASP